MTEAAYTRLTLVVLGIGVMLVGIIAGHRIGDLEDRIERLEKPCYYSDAGSCAVPFNGG